MIAHDYSKTLYDCPACKRLMQIKHDLSKPPKACPGCLEAAAIKGGYGAHATIAANGASAHHAAPAVHCAPVSPATATSNDLILSLALKAANEAVERRQSEQTARQKIAESWEAVIDDLNNRNRSPGGG